MTHDLRYQALVSARTSDEAIEIAAEALPNGRKIVRAEAEDVAQREGKDSWLVTLWFDGTFGRGPG
jgi:hypothetical protein